MKKIVNVILFCVFLTAFSCAAHADYIQLKNNSIVEGKIVEENDDHVRMDVGQGFVLTFFQDEIKKVSREDAPKPVLKTTPQTVRKKQPTPAVKNKTEAKKVSPVAKKKVITKTVKKKTEIVNKEKAKNFLWRVKSNTATVYLFGSIHIGKPEMYPLSPTVEKAFTKSNILVLEVDLEKYDPTEIQQRMMKKAMYSDGEKLEERLPKRTLINLKKRMRGYGIRLEQFSNFKPWFVSLMLTQFQVRSLGYNEEYGVDLYFARKARGKKKILEIESIEEQVSFLDNFPNQVKYLDYTLYYMDELEKELNDMIAAWERGDAAFMEKMIITDVLAKHPEFQFFYQKFFYDRNKKMAEKIKGYLKTKDAYFVVVGAGHLLSDQGVVGLLESQGFTVDQL